MDCIMLVLSAEWYVFERFILSCRSFIYIYIYISERGMRQELIPAELL